MEGIERFTRQRFAGKRNVVGRGHQIEIDAAYHYNRLSHGALRLPGSRAQPITTMAMWRAGPRISLGRMRAFQPSLMLTFLVFSARRPGGGMAYAADLKSAVS